MVCMLDFIRWKHYGWGISFLSHLEASFLFLTILNLDLHFWVYDYSTMFFAIHLWYILLVSHVISSCRRYVCYNMFWILYYHYEQVCLEGEISKKTIMNSLSRGKRASGDLIPWTVSQQVKTSSFPQEGS